MHGYILSGGVAETVLTVYLALPPLSAQSRGNKHTGGQPERMEGTIPSHLSEI